MIKGVSLFSSVGIGETFLKSLDIEVIVANELIKKRAELYRKIYPDTNMICGDIAEKKIFCDIMKASAGVELLLASPPCQGMSVAGKNRCNKTMIKDERNYLITYVVNAIKILSPKLVLIENVPALLKVELNYKGCVRSVLDILKLEFGKTYSIESQVLDAADYGVPQTRLRAIIKLYTKNIQWNWPTHCERKVTVRDAIADLPSLEAGEKSKIKWHYARKHVERHIIWMQNTPTGETAYSNDKYFPQRRDGIKIKGYTSSYRRIKWDEPAPTITIRNDAISSQRNVHPGRLKSDGTYSDARVLTPLELMILDSLPKNWKIPDDTSEILIRQCIGESMPPLMLKKILGAIKWSK